MFNKNKILLCIIVLNFFPKIVLAQCTDSRYYIQTPRGQDVPDTYQTCEFLYNSDRAGWDNYFATYYPNATQIILPGEQYSSTRTFNCHGYAWKYVENSQRLWIGYSQAGSEEVFWNDGSYDQVSEAVCTKISYSGDHSAVPSGTANYYYSKWRFYPLMYHHKDYTPGYGSANQFFRRSVDVPQDYATIASALSAAVSGQTVNVSSGSYTIASNLTVPSGVVIQVSSGVTLLFASGTSLTVNGTLNAVGTSSNPITFNRSGSSGTWGGIQFNYGSSGSISYANIRYATNGVYFNNTGSTSITISNCTIENNSTLGIYLYNSSPIISYNAIQNNGYYGIKCYSYSSPSIHHNNISGHTIQGVYLNYYSPAYLSYWTSGPGENLITNNAKGIYANYQCNAFIYYNYIYGNTSYELEGYQPLTIDAEYNWWGVYPPGSSEVYASGGAVIDYMPALSSGLGINGGSKINQQALHLMSATKDDLENAWELQLAGKYEEAIELYKSVFTKEQNTQFGKYALVRLEECYWKAKKEGFADYVSKEIFSRKDNSDELTVMGLELINHSLIDKSDYKGVIKNLEKIKNELSLNEDIEKNTLFALGSTYINGLNDKSQALKYFGELKQKYPNDKLVYDSEILLGNNPDQDLLNKKVTSSETNINIDEEFSIANNYPNPFNPTTIISFSIPEKSQIKLKVFDVLGREISVLADGVYEAGKHEVSFNAGNLPSGVYFYNLTTGSNSISKKMLLVK